MTASVHSITISEIAEWALPRQDISPSLNIAVQLPALQRGVVWSADQVERLWDSLVRGFPIGCLILCEPEERLAVKPFALQAEEPHRNIDQNPEHLLLDGQQRCTAIAMGFLNPWAIKEHYKANFALWVDLEAPEGKDVREFVFRLLTKSHPWGYQRQNPGDRLSVSSRREAMSEFKDSAQQLGHEGLTFRPGYLPLRFAWPRDAGAPLPVAFIIEAVGRLPPNTDDTRIWDEIRTDMNAKLGGLFDWIATSPNAKPSERRKAGVRLLELLQNPTPHMNRLLSGFRRLLDQSDSGFRIPAQLLPSEHVGGSAAGEVENEREDPIATLFIRINTEGTPPNDEELSYSVLKSIMPECREGVEQLSRNFMPAARMVLLLSTLVLGQEKDTPPAFPDVSRFRRLVQRRDEKNLNFGDELKHFLLKGEARQIVDAAYNLLVINGATERQFRLFPLQAARIAQNDGHAFLLLLAWIRSRKKYNKPWCGLDEEEHRRLIGAICVLSWFPFKREDTNRRLYLSQLWKNRGSLHEPGALSALLKPTDNDEIAILPLPPYNILAAAVAACVTGRGFIGTNTKLWNEWNFYENIETSLEDIDVADKWYKHTFKLFFKKNESEIDTIKNDCWTLFVQNMRNNREFVLYAQRRYLLEWFPDFDPTSPAQLQDTEQPWDYDHIHPQHFCKYKQNIPPIIKAWHGTIGNLRAWPSEVNRALGELAPKKKLEEPIEQEEENYKLKTYSDLRAASGIFDKAQIKCWNASCPDADAPSNYLADDQYHSHRQNLIKAITSRWVSLYRTWHEELRISQLFSP